DFLAVGLDGHNPGQAVIRFERAVDGHGPGFARSKAISCTKLASLVMHRGDPHEAAKIGSQALALGTGITSLRATDDLRELGRYAARHPRLPAARDLREQITATVRA
uniref:hypothetical protein n=1 Tax=Pseudomonas aeruginosa TaxID=287 RepID=UPI003CF2A08A